MGSWVTTTVTLTEDDFRAAPRLKLVQLMSAGYEHIDLDLAARYGVPVAHFGGSNASVVAEHCVMLILALYRQLFSLDAAVRDGSWRKGDPSLYELGGKRVGLIGLGYIGRELAVRLRAFGCRVVYFARHRVEQDLAEWLPLDDLLRTSDVVSLHVPIAPSTRGLLGARELGLMKTGSVLINTSRGGVVDESALLDALSAGRLAGAGLDVFEHEPPDPASPLLRLPNVIHTPHVAGSSVEVWPRVVDICFANIQRVRRGEPPLHLAHKLT
jgi:phosphoglycerate dehydrogenase-like enzyme